MRVKFPKGKQKEFIDKVLSDAGCPSLKELINRGIDANYHTLKNYYSGRRLLPENLFDLLCEMSGLDKDSLSVEKIGENWGQSKGGKTSRKGK